MKFIYIAFFIFLGSLSSQNFKWTLNHQPLSIPNYQKISDTLRILAVLVEFQEDNDATTIGNGKFNSIYSQNYNSIIDPLPHNANYFSAHLEFAKNYYKKISNGKQNISYSVVPQVITLSKTMKSYSPPIKSNDFTSVAEMIKEVWQKADSISPKINFSNYDLFFVFHAGAGREVSLPGSLGNERDLPSVFMSQNNLKFYFGNNFEGFPVSNNSFKINNTVLLPQTENREVESFGSKYLFELTINGLIVSNIASYFGLPDLYDTNTGLSAIGRFGLMDGQSIFAYNGAFPCEPSAWEKIFLNERLNWGISLKEFNFNKSDYTLTANNISNSFDTTILKVPINASEYFLLENRQRNSLKNGCQVTIWNNGNTYTKTFYKDTSGFYSFDIDSLEGVVIDVDEFDWALPGNGIVIWHINQNVIDNNLMFNSINVDKNNRGVDVEEADGIQDIGEKFQTIFGDILIGEGDSEDFWFSSNKSNLYKNIFNKNSRPNSNSSSGANSLIDISNFSDTTNRMTLKISYGENEIKPLFNNKLNFSVSSSKLTSFVINNKPQFFLTSNSNLYRFDENGNLLDSIINFSDFKPLVFKVDGFTTAIVGASKIKNIIPSKVNVLQITANSVKQISTIFPYNFSFGPAKTNYGTNIYLSSTDGRIAEYNIAVDTIKEVNISNPLTNKSIIKSTLISSPQNRPSPNWFISDKNLFSNSGLDSILVFEKLVDVVSTEVSLGNGKIYLLTNESIYVIDEKTKSTLKIYSHNGNVSALTIADVQFCNNNQIVFIDNKKLKGINPSGTIADNFPIDEPNGNGFVGIPLTIDFANDSKAEIICYTNDGRIFAFDGGTGKMIDGFPISVGKAFTSVPVVFEWNGKIYLSAIANNYFSSWQISNRTGKFYWSQENGNIFNNSFVEMPTSTSAVSDFFPKSKAYNWPNPVYENQTFIRYYVSEDSKINIKIFDLAGGFVQELNNTAIGSMDNETIWNVSDIQSGIYLARIEAAGNSGKKETAIIKIAVVK